MQALNYTFECLCFMLVFRHRMCFVIVCVPPMVYCMCFEQHSHIHIHFPSNGTVPNTRHTDINWCIVMHKHENNYRYIQRGKGKPWSSNQAVSQTVRQAVSQSVSQAVSQTVSQAGSEPDSEPASEPGSEPGHKLKSESD